jgi:RNA polymerase sigma factor (sigma-70 family)
MTDTPILRALSAAVSAPDAAPDGELLHRFAEAADRSAFELVVRRHAEMVWGVCRSALGRDRHAAEDAFQATFLILARKAATIREASAAGWLFRVARNVAVRARSRAAQRDAQPLHEALAAMCETAEESTSREEIAPLVMEELDRLGRKFRDPVVLCFFEGHTHAEAAARLGWPIGTVASRLARAKDLLRDRLTRRGVVLPAAGLGAIFSAAPASAAPLVHSTVAAAVGPAGGVPPAVHSLSQGVLSAMRYAKLKLGAAILGVALTVSAALALVPKGTAADPSALTPAGQTLVVVPAGITVRPAAKAQDDKAGKELTAKELKAMQGSWRIVKVESNGVELPADAIATARWTVKKDEIEVTDEFTEEPTVLKLVISPEQNPKHFDTTMTKVGKHKKAINNQGAGVKDKLVPGLYKRDGDNLTVCMRSPENLDDGRPKEVKAGDGVVLVVLERVKDEKEERQALAGEWTVKSVIAAGKDDPAGQVGKTRWIFEGDKVTWLEPNAISPIMGLKLDPTAAPPTIDFLTTDGKDVRLSGIYFRQGDKLTVCIRFRKSSKKDRPGELKPADEVNYMILERVAKQGDPVVRP